MRLSEKELEQFSLEGAIFDRGVSTVWIGFGDSSWHRRPKPGHLSFYSPDFYLENPMPWLNFREVREVQKTALLEWIKTQIIDFSEVKWKPAGFSAFKHDFDLIKKQIRNGMLVKAVPIVAEHGRSFSDPISFHLHLLSSLLSAPKHLKAYGFWNLKEGMLGATPEVLFIQQSQKDLITMALAGTFPRQLEPSRNGNRAWIHEGKIHSEHEVVIDGILESLRPHGAVTIKPSKLLHLPSFDHVQTHISAHFHHPLSLQKITQILHPTPALGGFPKRESVSFLKTLHEQKTRRRFGAPFGIRLPNGQSSCLVAIRNVQWEDEKVDLYSGCGIVRDSHLFEEWKELKMKRDSVKNLLHL